MNVMFYEPTWTAECMTATVSPPPPLILIKVLPLFTLLALD